MYLNSVDFQQDLAKRVIANWGLESDDASKKTERTVFLKVFIWLHPGIVCNYNNLIMFPRNRIYSY